MSKSSTPAKSGIRTDPLRKFDAFWHLQAIGLLTPTGPLPAAEARVETEAWKEFPKGVSATVCLIDTGVSDHPYLHGKLVPPYNVDLTGAPVSVKPGGSSARSVLASLSESVLTGLKLTAGTVSMPVEKYLKELVERNKDRFTSDANAPDTANRRFSAHGTSCAGLVAASSRNDPDDQSVSRPFYRGVDPDSSIMSITTSFAPQPDMLTLAFLLAFSRDVDVILFPRGLPREILAPDETMNPDGWRALKETILAVSKKRPVVCAVGNESDEIAIAPACFAAPDNGIIGVAAMNCNGVRSSYSNFGKGVTIAAPSDDAEIFNRDQVRFDRRDRFFGDYPYDAHVKYFGIKEVKHGEAGIKAIDVPGPFGFSDTKTNAEASLATSSESYFTEFGGTSAAASIVAGVAALMQRAAKSKKNGVALGGERIREILQKTAITGTPPHLESGADVDEERKRDWVNGERLEFQQAYGAGLVAADAAVKMVLDSK